MLHVLMWVVCAEWVHITISQTLQPIEIHTFPGIHVQRNIVHLRHTLQYASYYGTAKPTTVYMRIRSFEPKVYAWLPRKCQNSLTLRTDHNQKNNTKVSDNTDWHHRATLTPLFQVTRRTRVSVRHPLCEEKRW